MSYAWIVIAVIVLFLVYHFFTWYNKGGAKKLDAIIKAFNKEKDKILSEEDITNNDTSKITIPKDNI